MKPAALLLCLALLVRAAASAGDCDRLGVVGLDCVLRVYASGPGWRSAGAGRAATEFRALAHELARHLTVEVSS